jgi:hypothetical protein
LPIGIVPYKPYCLMFHLLCNIDRHVVALLSIGCKLIAQKNAMN